MNAPHEAALHARLGASWAELNQRWMVRELSALRLRLQAALRAADPASPGLPAVPDAPPEPDTDDSLPGDGFISAIDRCSEIFSLSAFERELLLLTAGVELDRALRRTVTEAQARFAQRKGLSQPTFALAMRVLAQPHWDALSPQAPLRRWRLLELEGPNTPAQQPLHMDERVLHYLTGTPAADMGLFGLARLEGLTVRDSPSPLAQLIAQGLTSRDARLPLMLLTQDHADPEALCTAALHGLAALGTTGLWLQACDLPTDARTLAETALLVDREAVFTGSIPVIELDAIDESPAAREHAVATLISHLLSPVLLLGAPDAGWLVRLPRRRIARAVMPEANGPGLRAQVRQLTQEWLRPAQAEALARALQPALQQFRLPASALRRVIEEAVPAASGEGETDGAAALGQRVWQACRVVTRGGLDALAQRIDSEVCFEDLVLPAGQLRMLQDITGHLRHRYTVYERWGMGGKTTRGRGLCALFAGESGTGKTLAAEAIANEAALDLYRIDLASVVSKYIGETEKNLKRVFDAAESSGAVLLFDEADALFGKRSEVKDSHDRYANIEVAYLLQRIESYRGLAVLTTNQKSALDRAFLRRIRFVVNFPFPSLAARCDLWRRAFAPAAPVGELDFGQLARLPLSGGAIRNVALHAAFVAAARGTAIDASAVAEGARFEYAKNDRPGAGLPSECVS